MNQKILDDVEDLLNLSDEELREVLIEPRYNSANLCEMIRRSLQKTKEYKNAWEYEKEKNEELEEKVEEVKNKMKHFWD